MKTKRTLDAAYNSLREKIGPFIDELTEVELQSVLGIGNEINVAHNDSHIIITEKLEEEIHKYMLFKEPQKKGHHRNKVFGYSIIKNSETNKLLGKEKEYNGGNYYQLSEKMIQIVEARSKKIEKE